jgi:cytochrome c oxidase subunit 2
MHMRIMTGLSGIAASFGTLSLGGMALAQENGNAGRMVDGLPIVGKPVDGLMGFQPAATELATQIHSLDHMINVIITIITVFVTALLLWCAYRFAAKRNMVPAKFTHNSPLEVAWTIVPIVILVFIGAFSLPVLFNQQEIPKGDINIKVTGYQWYWG